MDPAMERPALIRRGLLLEYLTVGWNVVEGLVAVVAGVASGSIALIAFGIDSVVEMISGVVLIWRLRTEEHGELDQAGIERVERRAEQLVGVSFLILAAYVAFESVRTLATAEAPEPSPVGIVLTPGPSRRRARRWAVGRSSRMHTRHAPAGTCPRSPWRAWLSMPSLAGGGPIPWLRWPSSFC
jgi:hypothetical protein